MKKILVDTDIIIDYSKGITRILQILFEKNNHGEIELAISSMNMVEFLVDNKLIKKKFLNKAINFLSKFELVEINKGIAIKTAELLRCKKIDSLPDAYIAATCIVKNLTLATRNLKHFKNVPELEFWHLD